MLVMKIYMRYMPKYHVIFALLSTPSIALMMSSRILPCVVLGMLIDCICLYKLHHSK